MTQRLPALLLALLLGSLALLVAACGDEEEGRIAPARAERLMEDLDAIDAAVAAGRCDAVDGRLDSLRAEVEDLPRSVDPALRRRLEQGVEHLEEQAPDECREQEEQQEEQQETVPEPAPEPEPEPETQPETVPPETTPTETSPPTTPTQTTPEEDLPPGQGGVPPGQQDGDDDSGGTEAPAGVVVP